MLSFFRISTSYKYYFLLLIFVVCRALISLYFMPLLYPELNYFLVAQKLQQGFSLYKDIWDTISPFMALVYGFLYPVLERNIIFYHLIAIFFIVWQAFSFNALLVGRQILKENTLLPALLYLILMSLFIDYYPFSSTLLANSFLLLVIKAIFVHLNEKNNTSTVFEVGAYIGLASLLYLPAVLLFAVPLLVFLLFTSTAAREYFIMIFSLVFTILIAFLVFYVYGTEGYFYDSFLKSIIVFEFDWILPFWQIAVLLGFSLFLSFSLLLTPLKFSRYNNYQNRCANTMFLWLSVSLILPFFSNNIAPHSFMPSVPALAFLLSHYFLNVPNKWLAEAVFTLWLGGIVYLNYITFYDLRLSASPDTYLSTQNLVVAPLHDNALVKGKKILVLGKDWRYYKEATLATPYLNYTLSQEHFKTLDSYNVLVAIYNNFKQDLPEVIIDQKNVLPTLFAKLPLLAQHYEQANWQNRKVYIKKKR